MTTVRYMPSKKTLEDKDSQANVATQRVKTKEEATESDQSKKRELQEVRVGCQACGATLSVSTSVLPLDNCNRRKVMSTQERSHAYDHVLRY